MPSSKLALLWGGSWFAHVKSYFIVPVVPISQNHESEQDTNLFAGSLAKSEQQLGIVLVQIPPL